MNINFKMTIISKKKNKKFYKESQILFLINEINYSNIQIIIIKYKKRHNIKNNLKIYKKKSI